MRRCSECGYDSRICDCRVEMVKCSYGSLCPPFPKSEMSKAYTVPVCPKCVKDIGNYGTH